MKGNKKNMDWEKIYYAIKNEAFSIKYCIFMGIIRSISKDDLEFLLAEMEWEIENGERK